MDSSESLQIDEHLARLLAAYDQGIEGGDGKAPTIGVPQSPAPSSVPVAREELVKPLSSSRVNEGSEGELLPDSRRGHAPASVRLPATTPAPNGGAHRIGRFELRRQLGKGGCGIVFLAYDPKLEREVALKIPRPEMLLSPDARRRLIREALAAAEFDHPNLVPVYETGEIGPICFIATAFCPGQTLGEWLDRQAFPVPVRQAARVVATVAEAVQHAHDRGVLHRDLKPNNVILQASKDDSVDEVEPRGSCLLRGEAYIPRVVDFGLAKLLERGGPSETNTRQILGTPKYMAPEQAQARHEDVGPTVDVYALGVILYEMLAGCAPYDGATDVEVLRQAIDGRLTNPRHIRPDIPRDLEAICLKAMERSPAKRYRTAIDLADDLHRFLDGKPTLARPLKWPGRAVRWFRRNDQVVALTVVTVIAAVLFAVGAWYMRQTRQLKNAQNRVALEQAERTQSDQHREYARTVHEAFLARRSGNGKAMAEVLDAARRLASTGGETPDFALRYLAQLAKDDRTCLICPAGPVTALAVSRNTQRLATGHSDGTVAIWDRASGEQLSSIRAHEGEVTHVAFALDDSRVVTAGGTRARPEPGLLWALNAPGRLSPAPDRHRLSTSSANCLTVSPNGQTVYIGTSSGELEVVSLNEERRSVSESLPTRAAVTALALTADGNVLLVGTGGGRVFRYSSTLKRLDAGGEHTFPILSLFAVGDGTSYQSGTIEGVYQEGTARAFQPTHGRVHWIVPLAGHGFAACEGPGRVILWDGGWRHLLTGDVGELRAGAMTRDGKTLFTAGDDGIIRSWQFPDDLATHATWSGVKARAIGVYPDGRRVAVSTPGVFRDQFGSKRETTIVSGAGGFAALQGLKDNRMLGVEFRDRMVVIRDPSLDPGQALARFPLPDGATPACAHLSADGSRVAVGDDRGRVFVWNIQARTLLATMDCGQRGRVARVALSEDGKRVAAPTLNGILLGVVEEPATRITVAGDNQAVFRFLPGGDRFISGDRSGSVRVWLTDGSEESTFYGHVGRITGLGVSPDGRIVVSGDASGEVKFWDARSGQELITLRRHLGPVTTIEFAQNGKLLVTGGDGQVAFWEAGE